MIVKFFELRITPSPYCNECGDREINFRVVMQDGKEVQFREVWPADDTRDWLDRIFEYSAKAVKAHIEKEQERNNKTMKIEFIDDLNTGLADMARRREHPAKVTLAGDLPKKVQSKRRPKK